MFDRIQKIGPVIGSNNLIINGDVIANGDMKNGGTGTCFTEKLS